MSQGSGRKNAPRVIISGITQNIESIKLEEQLDSMDYREE